jgi:rhodanese-related sulfurtransferase
MLEISVTELKDKLDAGENLQLIDVRETWELEICQLDGIKNLPMTEIAGRVEEVEKNIETIVICHHGGRSMQVAMWLEQQGLDEMTNLAGGMDAWANIIDPSMDRY